MILKFRELNKLQKEKVVYTAGSFDLLHTGHIDYLRLIKEKFPGYKLIVGLLPDQRIAAKKGKERPIINQHNRLKMIDALKFVDYCFICPLYKEGQDATYVIVKKLKPEHVVFPQKKYLKHSDWFKEQNINLSIGPRTRSQLSTSIIIEKIKKLK